MFLLPSIVVGIGFALLLGGRPSRILELELHRGWAVLAALGLQIALFGPWPDGIPFEFEKVLHLGSYALLVLFAAANVRHRALLPLLAGMALNAIAIAANGGQMPVSPGAQAAAGIELAPGGNVRPGAETFGFLGDVFALPAGLPLANVFSVGDLLIAAGTVLLIVSISLGGRPEPALDARRLFQPLRNPFFRRLAAGKLVSHFGDWLGGRQLLEVELPGPEAERLTTRIRDTARRLWLLYVGLTGLLIALLSVFAWTDVDPEMSAFDAVAHAFTTLPTGGFSTRARGVEEFGAASQWAIVVFMVLAGANFALMYRAFLQRRVGPLLRD